MHNRKRSASKQKGPFLTLRAALVAQGPVDITRRIQEGANAGDTVYQLRVRVDQVALEQHEEICVIIDIATISIAIDMTNFGKKWPKQLEPAESELNETSHAYTDCAGAVSLAESASIAEIHHIIPDQPLSKYLIDDYFMCLTAGVRLRSIRFPHPTQGQSGNQASASHRSALAQFPPSHRNGSYYGKRNSYRERGHRLPNNNQRAQNHKRRAEQNPQ
ncbi:MAG: hypothetical protein EZS28_048497 [Streblomastix strix]|uniref:Uncharacterized protein n=1 Tax=Streblomastix strix TaxID=222440 RepID=A0A5J4TCI7_9EUKA|nr:MAG: hypothetical protein EZS28_048497 [Streblomastix strix]